MKSAVRAVCVSMILLLAPAVLHAKAFDGRPLGLDEFIRLTIQHNPTVRAYLQRYAEARGNAYAALGVDDVGFESIFEAAKTENADITGFNSTEDKTIQYQVGLSKVVSQTGTRLSATYANRWMRSQYPAAVQALGPINPVYTPSVTLTLTQPLLKNILGRQDQLNKRVTRIQREAAEVQYQENVEAFISEMSNLYFQWANAYYNALFLRDVYHKAVEQTKLVREQVAAKVSEESDLYRMLEQRENYRGQMEGALADFEAYRAQVAAMMQPDAPPSAIVPTARGGFLAETTRRSDGMAYLERASRLRRILDLSLAVQDEVSRARQNARLPDLDVFVEYSRTGAAPDFDTAHGSSFEYDDISGGLSLSVPLPDRAARGDYRAQQATFKRVNLENQRTMLDATAKLKGLYEQRERLLRQVDAYEQQVHYGDLKLKQENKQYKDGRLSLFELLQDVSTFTSQKITLHAAQVNLALTEVLIGELTDVNYELFRPTIDAVTEAQE